MREFLGKHSCIHELHISYIHIVWFYFFRENRNGRKFYCQKPIFENNWIFATFRAHVTIFLYVRDRYVRDRYVRDFNIFTISACLLPLSICLSYLIPAVTMRKCYGGCSQLSCLWVPQFLLPLEIDIFFLLLGLTLFRLENLFKLNTVMQNYLLFGKCIGALFCELLQ